MRKHEGSTPPFTATTLREFPTINRPKKLLKTITTSLQQDIAIAPTHRTVMSTKGKGLAWEAYRNELEFE